MKLIRKILGALVLVTWIGGWSLAALSLHVVRTPETITLIPKNRLSVTDTYVDTREWTPATVLEHPDVVKRIFDTGKADLLSNVATGSELEKLQHDVTSGKTTFTSVETHEAAHHPTEKAPAEKNPAEKKKLFD